MTNDLINEIVKEILSEDDNLEQEAFELFCKDRMAGIVKRKLEAELMLERINKEYRSMTPDKLEKEFDHHDIYTQTSPKEKYTKMVLAGDYMVGSNLVKNNT